MSEKRTTKLSASNYRDNIVCSEIQVTNIGLTRVSFIDDCIIKNGAHFINSNTTVETVMNNNIKYQP